MTEGSNSLRIRSLDLSPEIIVFMVVISITSAIYLFLNTREPARPDLRVTPTGDLAVGKTIDISVTLVTADQRDLACAADDMVGTAHCAFNMMSRPFTLPSGETPTKPDDIIQPFMTTDNVLFLIPGLWQEPAIAARAATEPYTKWERDQLHRFAATCKLSIQGKLDKFKTRWQLMAPFGDGSNAWVGRLSGCKVEETG